MKDNSKNAKISLIISIFSVIICLVAVIISAINLRYTIVNGKATGSAITLFCCMEPAVAGYDLLNEPLPDWFSIYNHMVVPLYRKIIDEIRRVDNQHLIILEGIHWATNWDIFNEFEDKPIDDNIMLQFHKYWSSPDEESLEQYINLGKKLNLPIFMGEGGENNLDWYTGLFPMYIKVLVMNIAGRLLNINSFLEE